MIQESQVVNETDPHAPNIGALFKKYAEGSNEDETIEPIAEKKIEKKENKSSEAPKKEAAPEVKLKVKEEDSTEPAIDWKAEHDKLQRNLKETRKWGDDRARQLAAYKKATERLKEEGNLTEEEAAALLTHTKYEELEKKDKTLIERLGDVWEAEIENIRKYSEYPELDRHMRAFQHFVQNGVLEEINEAAEELKDLIDSNPVLCTKKMLEIGKRHHDDVFSELIDAGNLKNFKRQYEDKIESSQKKIDKLEKEIAKLKDKYEGYDENPQYRLPQGGDSSGGAAGNFASIKNPGELIAKYNQGKYPFPR